MSFATAAIVSIAFAVPVPVGRIAEDYSLVAAPSPSGGGWISLVGNRQAELVRVTEGGALSHVVLPPQLREGVLRVYPLADGWTVVMGRYWPGGKREVNRCSPENSAAVQETHCGVLVAAQYDSAAHLRVLQRLGHSSGAEAEGSVGETAAALEGGRIEVAWGTNQADSKSSVAVALARPGRRFGRVRIAGPILRGKKPSVEFSAYRGALYERGLYGPEDDEEQVVERRLYGNGRLGPVHLVRSSHLHTPYPEPLHGPLGSELLAFQEETTIGVARRKRWSSSYEPAQILTRTALNGFQASQAPDGEALISVRARPSPTTKESGLPESELAAARLSAAGVLGPLETLENPPGNSSGYEWTSAIDDAGQALVGSVESNEVSQSNGGAPLWLHGSALGCGGFQARTALTSGSTQASVSTTEPASELTVFAGPRDVFHLVWVAPGAEVMTSEIRVTCATEP